MMCLYMMAVVEEAAKEGAVIKGVAVEELLWNGCRRGSCRIGAIVKGRCRSRCWPLPAGDVPACSSSGGWAVRSAG
jgi:hypothetical protein